jgi:hypothetical protein
VFLIVRNKTGTVKQELRDFAVKDTAAINRIFIADRRGNSVVLEREKNSSGIATGLWLVNKKYHARKDAIKILLETLYNVQMRNYVAKSAYNTIVKQLASTGIKCEVYLNDNSKPYKVIYVGSSTQDTKGTFMMLENSSVPFVTEIPGFDGYLTPRFFVNEAEWRWKNVFNLRSNEIGSVEVSYNPDLNRSFRIKYDSENNFSVSSPVSGAVLLHPDTTKVVNYLSQFTDVNFEFFDFMMNKQQRDSMLQHQPQAEMILTDKVGKVNRVKFYPMQVNQFSIAKSDTIGNEAKFDADRLYAFMNHDSDLVGVQVFVFGKLFRQLADFDASILMKRQR